MRAPGGISLLEISSLALTATMRSLVARSPLCSAPAPRQGFSFLQSEGESRKRGISSETPLQKPEGQKARRQKQAPIPQNELTPSRAPRDSVRSPWGAEVAYVVLILAFSNYLLIIPEFAWAGPDTFSTLQLDIKYSRGEPLSHQAYDAAAPGGTGSPDLRPHRPPQTLLPVCCRRAGGLSKQDNVVWVWRR